MNNYDDIKRFKEKLNLEGIDYKEIVESRPNNTTNNWAIIKQVATADEPFHPLEHGHTTQPTPAPVSQQEFSPSAFVQPERVRASSHGHHDKGIFNSFGDVNAPAQEQAFASPLLSALSRVMPPAADAVIPGVIADTSPSAAPVLAGSDVFAAPAPKNIGGATLFNTASRQDFAPTAPAPARPSLAPRTLFPTQSSASSQATAPTPPDNTKRFNKLFNRKSHLPAGIAPTRDMPLSLLLENIALCR